MIMNSFRVDQPKGSKTVCYVCRGNIIKNTIRILKKTAYTTPKYYHLPCYTPKFNQSIRKRDLCIILDEESSVVFNDWLENWNKNHYPLDTQQEIKIQSTKLIPSRESKIKRVLLEIFKFLDPFEMAMLSLVNKEFYHVSWDKELWYYFLSRDFNINSNSEDLKSLYFNEMHKRCVECKQSFENSQTYRCPLLKRAICYNCKHSEKYKVLSKSDIKRLYGINPDKLNIKYGNSFRNKKICYKYMIEEAVSNYEKNKSKGKKINKNN